MIQVYELRVGERVIDVGVTGRAIEHRLYEHTCKSGRWPNRTDITIHAVSQWPTLSRAMQEEGRLKLHYGFEWTEMNGAGNQKATNSLVNWNKNGITPEQHKKAGKTRSETFKREGTVLGTHMTSTCEYCGKVGQRAGMGMHIKSCKRKHEQNLHRI